MGGVVVRADRQRGRSERFEEDKNHAETLRISDWEFFFGPSYQAIEEKK
jgi:hypothetical protein